MGSPAAAADGPAEPGAAAAADAWTQVEMSYLVLEEGSEAVLGAKVVSMVSELCSSVV